jgi:hypothetical protein
MEKRECTMSTANSFVLPYPRSDLYSDFRENLRYEFLTYRVHHSKVVICGQFSGAPTEAPTGVLENCSVFPTDWVI